MDFRQRYDYTVNEFEPPIANKIPFSEVGKLRKIIEECELIVYVPILFPNGSVLLKINISPI